MEHKRVYRCILSLQYKYTISLSTHESKHKNEKHLKTDDNEKSNGEEEATHTILGNLCTETVKRTARTFESINDIEGCDSLALGVFGVCYRITNDLRVEQV